MLGIGYRRPHLVLDEEKLSIAGDFLMAWLTASYALGVLHRSRRDPERSNFFVYPLPSQHRRQRATCRYIDHQVDWPPHSPEATSPPSRQSGEDSARLPLVIGALGGTGLVTISAASWVANYSGPGDGVAQIDRFIATHLPGCAVS